MAGHGVPIGVPAPGQAGPSASWREEDGRQNAVVGMSGRVYDLILVEQPEKLASIAEATLEDALFESGRPVMSVAISEKRLYTESSARRRVERSRLLPNTWKREGGRTRIWRWRRYFGQSPTEFRCSAP